MVQMVFMSVSSPFRQSHRTELAQALEPRCTPPHCCFHIYHPALEQDDHRPVILTIHSSDSMRCDYLMGS